MELKDFKSAIDLIIYCETPEKQELFITDLYKKTQALQFHKTNVSGSFLVLVHAHTFVDYNLLPKGIYSTSVPRLFPKETTIESLEQQGKMSKDLVGNYFLPESYFENLRKCQLIDIGLVEIK